MTGSIVVAVESPAGDFVGQWRRSLIEANKEAELLATTGLGSMPIPYMLDQMEDSIRQSIARGDLGSLRQVLTEIQRVLPGEETQKLTTELLNRAQKVRKSENQSTIACSG